MADRYRAFRHRQRVSVWDLGGTGDLLLALSLGLFCLAHPLLAAQPAATRPLSTARVGKQKAATAAPKAGQQKVTVIVIRGNRRVPSSKLLKIISIHPEDIYDPTKVEHSVTALKDTGCFDDVRAVTADDPTGAKNGKMLEFYVREKKNLALHNGH